MTDTRRNWLKQMALAGAGLGLGFVAAFQRTCGTNSFGEQFAAHDHRDDRDADRAS